MVAKPLRYNANHLHPINYSIIFVVSLPHSSVLPGMNTAAPKFQSRRLKFTDFSTITNLKQQSPENLLTFLTTSRWYRTEGDSKIPISAPWTYKWIVYSGRKEKCYVSMIGMKRRSDAIFCRRLEYGEYFEFYPNTIPAFWFIKAWNICRTDFFNIFGCLFKWVFTMLESCLYA